MWLALSVAGAFRLILCIFELLSCVRCVYNIIEMTNDVKVATNETRDEYIRNNRCAVQMCEKSNADAVARTVFIYASNELTSDPIERQKINYLFKNFVQPKTTKEREKSDEIATPDTVDTFIREVKNVEIKTNLLYTIIY